MRTILSVLFVGFVLTAPGCNERKSTPVGGEVIDLDDWGQFRQVLFQPASRDSVYRAAIPTNAGPLLLVGEWSGYQTRSLLKFEALPESVQVSSASVTLVTYDVIDTLTTLQTFVPESIWVVVSLLDTDWNGSDVTFDTPLSGTPVETVAVGRSRGDSLVFSLPTGVVQAWIDGTEENNGLLLSCAGEPIVAQGEGFIKEFYSLNSQSGPPPQLRVTWAVTDTSDTTLNTPPTADVFVVKRDIEWPIEGWPDWLTVGNGAVYRSLLQFNVRDSIPEEATVIRALFTLYVEGEYSFFSSMDLGVYAVTSPAWDEPQFGSSPIAQARVTAEEGSVVFDIHSLVQDWVAGERLNYGLLVGSTHEDWGITSFVFHSSRGAPGQGPRLDVEYATPPEFGPKRSEEEIRGER